MAEARATAHNRTLKVLEDANIKLASVASDVLGVSGRAMLRALIEGHDAPAELADLARGAAEKPERARALEGRLTEHHRFLLPSMRRMEAIEADLRALDERIEEEAEPFEASGGRCSRSPASTGDRGRSSRRSAPT